MDETGKWRLSPAYDLTYIIDAGGYLPNTGHSMYVRAKLHNISYDDAIEFAKDNGIRRADSIIQAVVGSLKQFRTIAQKYAVQDRWINTVEDAINRHLDLWGFANSNKTAVNLVINGTQYNNVRIEQTYKGNFHLYANINGAERKYVIGKNKSEYGLIQSIGVSNLSKDLLADMVEKFLCHSDYC